jgi:hypothetical protein
MGDRTPSSGIVGGLFLLLTALVWWALASAGPPRSTLSALILVDSQFLWSEEGRSLELRLLNGGLRPVRPDRLRINRREVLTWEAEPRTIPPEEEGYVRVRFDFRPGEPYALELTDDRGRRFSTEVIPPEMPKVLELERFQAERTASGVQVELALRAAGYGSLTLLVEPFVEFGYESASRPIYLFADVLSDEARAHADAFLGWAARLDPPLAVQTIGREALARLSAEANPGVLLVFTPLQGYRGPVEDVLPAELFNPGILHLQSLLRAGLVLVTPTTTHPLRLVLRSDGRTQSPLVASPGLMLTGKLNVWWSVSAQPTRNAPAARALLWGRYRGEYGGARELAGAELYGYQEAVNTFGQGPPEVRGRTLHLYNPFYLRSGDGGWLAFAHDPPSPETLGHDLALALVHAPWRGRWLDPVNPGWVEQLEIRGGRIDLERRFEIELPNSSNISEPRVLRLLVLAEDPDRERLVRREWIAILPAKP